jgi:FAD/FMN-containing dehydrogenase
MTGNDQSIQDRRRELVQQLGEDMVLVDAEAMSSYCRDWHGDVQGSALAIIRPRSTADVSDAVKLCGEVGLGIVPQGGNTGLVTMTAPETIAPRPSYPDYVPIGSVQQLR